MPSTSVLSLPAREPEGVSTPSRKPKPALLAEKAFRGDSERTRTNQQVAERFRSDRALVRESDRPPPNVVRFPGRQTSPHVHDAPSPTEPPANFLTQIIGQEVQPEELDAPALSRRHQEGVTAYETTLARTKTIAGPASPTQKRI